MTDAPNFTEDKTIEPGVYDIGNDEYHNGPGISRSGILLLKKSPYHFWNKYLRPDREPQILTPALKLGNALHTAILEPAEFNRRYLVVEKVNRTTKEGKAYFNEQQERASVLNKEIIMSDVFCEMENMINAVEKHPTAKEIITGASYEKSIYWTDPDTGILCKCRPDILHKNFIGDLKTAADASYHQFQRDVYEYGYHIQAAMALEASRHGLKKEMTDFFFVVVEKSEPYPIGVYFLDENAIKKGMDDFKNGLEKYKKCLDENHWPSYEIKQVSLPAYAFYQ